MAEENAGSQPRIPHCRPMERITIQFDGGSRGNPGPAGIGIVLSAVDGTPLVALGRCIGRATNNVAEYKALIAGLQEAKRLGATKVLIRGDSELIIKQLRGEYRVRHPDMIILHAQARRLLDEFDQAVIEHNLRAKNVLADKLVNLALDRRADVTDTDMAVSSSVEPDEPSAAAAVGAVPKPGGVYSCPRCGCTIGLVRLSSFAPDQLKDFVCQCGIRMRAES